MTVVYFIHLHYNFRCNILLLSDNSPNEKVQTWMHANLLAPSKRLRFPFYRKTLGCVKLLMRFFYLSNLQPEIPTSKAFKTLQFSFNVIPINFRLLKIFE
jgi:hypothetical protein